MCCGNKCNINANSLSNGIGSKDTEQKDKAMEYKIIIYKLIIFEIKQKLKDERVRFYKDDIDLEVGIGSNTRTLTKRYFQKVKTIHGISAKEMTKTYLEYKRQYADSSYIFSTIKEDEEDWYINKMNDKSERAYIEWVKNGGIK